MYVGQKGFTVLKSELQPASQNELRKELTFAAKTMYLPGPPFFAWRESPNKFYLPRFYGEAKFGRAALKLPPGQRVVLPFKGEVREAQRPAIDAFLAAGNGLLELPCGFGKTILSLYLISQLGLKTLIVVHKEFLMEQWVERIAEFLPTAKVGRIQGTTLDISGKDIVIGMLQSLSMKEYEPGVFDSFGFTIVDETHHIAAEVFSNSLFKIVTPHMLGLSATMERKDGLSKVFKLFLGEIVYTARRDKVDNMLVHKVVYVSDDAEFKKTETNFRGHADYTVMIRKLCAFSPRNEFILVVLQHLLTDARNAQIMVLSQNRALLDYLHAAIEHRGIAPVGFYVGGMKPKALKKSEECRLILGTFAMAEEALDIKTLTTLVLATSKTGVEQAVGRILRVKHEQPLVVDIVDEHETFKNQWKKRKSFYVQNGYRIVQSESPTYPALVPEKKKVGKCLLLS
jgi:superfamily II DNA or RNA helicase